MTYLITPDNNAISVDDNQFYLVYSGPTYAVVQTPRYRGSSDYIDISPQFIYTDYMFDDMTKDNAKGDATYQATMWLKDLLIRLASKPILIHCVSDGEIFLLPEALMRR